MSSVILGLAADQTGFFVSPGGGLLTPVCVNDCFSVL